MNITTESDRAKIKEYFKQALTAMRRIEEEQAGLKDILNVLKEEHEIKPTIARKVLKTMEKGNMPEVRQINNDMEDLYEVASGFVRMQSQTEVLESNIA